MKKKNIKLLILIIILIPVIGFAENNTQTQDVKISPTHDKNIPLVIEYKEADKLGRVLGLRLEEKASISNLFNIVTNKEKSLHIKIKSKQEFGASNPLRSVCSIVWTFYYGGDVLSSFLFQEVLIIDRTNIDLEADNILAITSNIAKEYNHLLK